MNPYRIILNPAAGHGNGKRMQPVIEAAMARCQIPYDLVCTTAPGDAIQIARQAVQDGVDVIVAAGGDGTLNEIVNGLMAARQAGCRLPALGVLGVGRGNDFSGSVGIPAEINAACQLLKQSPRRLIDIGRVTGGIFPNGRYFINVVGIGFDAVGTIEAAKLPRWGGFLSFVIAIFKTIFLYNQAPQAEIDYDGKVLRQRSLLISMMNGRRVGGGFFLAPTARQDDGLLDLCIAEQMSSLQIIRLIPHFTKGTHVSQPKIKMAQARRVTITALDGPLPAQTDGEIFSTDGRCIEVEILPRQLEVICP
jgi:YegS/Rv2252/BmrU family lipid kinase